MPQNKDTQITNEEKAPTSSSGGFLFDLTLPPLAVILVGFVMICSLSQITIANTAPLPSPAGLIAPLFTPEVQYWAQKIVNWSEAWNLDPDLVATVMQIESCGNPRALSPSGAMGLFQVMPYHFTEKDDPFKPSINAQRGLAYLKQTLDTRGGSSKLALAGYNGGITGTKGPEYSWSGETSTYVYWGTGIYADAVVGKAHSERLDEWLAAGGAGLCKRASEYLGIVPDE
jgi:soluble lytic murein transglycosylase-like protein